VTYDNAASTFALTDKGRSAIETPPA
jgi:hypothetical protein